MTENEQQNEIDQRRIRVVTSYLVIGIFGVFVVTYLWGLVQLGNAGYWDSLAREHFKAAVGIPLAGLTAICLVFLLRTTSGPITFKAVGFEFKGASGPIIMWVLVFTAIVWAIDKLWAP